MPRIEYQLSFENYLEMTASRQMAPRHRAALVAAFLGATLIAAGYIYLRQSPPEGFTYIGGILLATGLLSTALATLLGLLAKPKSRKTPTTTLQHEYENHFCDKRAIEFDEQGWRVSWYQGEDVRPWSNVTVIHNLKTLLVLATETTYYWFPKSALEPDGNLDRLKALAGQAIGKHVVLFRIPMRPSPVVFVAANLIHNCVVISKPCRFATLPQSWLFTGSYSQTGTIWEHFPFGCWVSPHFFLLFASACTTC